jgi:hypothetical protein
MMKKSGAVAALTAALLAMAVLVTTGCLIPEPETGGGKVRIIFGEYTDAKTVIPNAPTFLSYTLNFAGQETVNETVNAPATTFADIELAAGTYTLTVLGNTTGGTVAKATTDVNGGITTSRDLPTAGTGFTVVPDDFTVITVVLKPSTDGTGTFTWNVTTTGFTGTVVVSLVGGGAGGGANGSSITVTPGYYPILVNIDGGVNGDLIFGDYAHIYQNSTSTFTKNFELKHLVPPPPVPNPGEGRGGITYTHPVDNATGATVAAVPTLPAGSILIGGVVVLSLSGKTVGSDIYPTTVTLTPSGTGTALYYGDDLVTVADVADYPFNGIGERELTLWYTLNGVTHTTPYIIQVEN